MRWNAYSGIPLEQSETDSTNLFLFSRTTKTQTSEEWETVELSRAQSEISKQIFLQFGASKRELKLDLPTSWTESSDSMSVCAPQLRGALRAMSDEFPAERTKFEQLFKLTNALEVIRQVFVKVRLG
jgi:hypothetical protein